MKGTKLVNLHSIFQPYGCILHVYASKSLCYKLDLSSDPRASVTLCTSVLKALASQLIHKHPHVEIITNKTTGRSVYNSGNCTTNAPDLSFVPFIHAYASEPDSGHSTCCITDTAASTTMSVSVSHTWCLQTKTSLLEERLRRLTLTTKHSSPSCSCGHPQS
jgi:hypothetical protein